MNICVVHEGSEVEIAVQPSIGLTDLEDCIKLKLSCSSITKMEAFDNDFGEWLLITTIADIDLTSHGTKIKVQTVHIEPGMS